MSSLVLDLGLPSGNGYVQGRKQAKTSATGKDRERSCLRLQRIIIGRRVGTLLAFLISALSLLMLLNVTSRVASPSAKPATGDDSPLELKFNDQHQNFSREDSQLPMSRIPPPHMTVEGRESLQKVNVSFSSNLPPKRLERIQRHTNFSRQRIDSYQHMIWPSTSSDHPLRPSHPCQGFTLPPPPADKKRTGPRPCPVCYLPVEQAMDAMPMSGALQSSAIKTLSYAEELPMFPQGEKLLGTEFGGHPTLEDRWKSYQIQEIMKIHCGFAQGFKPGAGPGFEIEEADQMGMNRCTGLVVASAIIGNYDQLQQPENISRESMNSVCFFMFIDEETQRHLNTSEIKNSLWKFVVVRNLPYSDARRNGKIPKLLLHRLFPNARFSLWIDGKLKLVKDPYQVVERFDAAGSGASREKSEVISKAAHLFLCQSRICVYVHLQWCLFSPRQKAKVVFLYLSTLTTFYNLCVPKPHSCTCHPSSLLIFSKDKSGVSVLVNLDGILLFRVPKPYSCVYSGGVLVSTFIHFFYSLRLFSK